MDDDIAAYLAKASESLLTAEGEFAHDRYNRCANRCYYACFQAAIAALLGCVQKSIASPRLPLIPDATQRVPGPMRGEKGAHA